MPPVNDQMTKWPNGQIGTTAPRLLTAREVIGLVYAGAAKAPSFRVVYAWSGRGVKVRGSRENVRLEVTQTPSGMLWSAAAVRRFLDRLNDAKRLQVERRHGRAAASRQRPAVSQSKAGSGSCKCAADQIGTYPEGKSPNGQMTKWPNEGTRQGTERTPHEAARSLRLVKADHEEEGTDAGTHVGAAVRPLRQSPRAAGLQAHGRIAG